MEPTASLYRGPEGQKGNEAHRLAAKESVADLGPTESHASAEREIQGEGKKSFFPLFSCPSILRLR